MILFKTLLALWGLYNLMRVFQRPDNSIEVTASVPAHCSAARAFREYMNIGEYYLQLSPAHKRYQRTGDDLLTDTVIHICEQAGFQRVEHQYRVVELIPDRRMRLVSEHSRVTVLGLFRGESRSDTDFSFTPRGQHYCELGLSIQISFPNRLRHLLARLFFTEQIWQAHAREEMQALAAHIEQRETGGERRASLPPH